MALDIDRLVCAVCGRIDLDHRVTLAGAGAFPQPFLRRVNTEDATQVSVSSINLEGSALGLFAEETFSQTTVALERGEQLLIVTDGVLELIPEEGLARREERLAFAAAESNPLDFWRALNADPAARSLDDATRFSVERVQ